MLFVVLPIWNEGIDPTIIANNRDDDIAGDLSCIELLSFSILFMILGE